MHAFKDWPDDIVHKIMADFGQKNFETISKALWALYAQGADYRIVRCVLFLAQGNPNKMKHFIEQARLDFRDVIYWAEYDAQGRIRDFNFPFQ
ncbi:MAG: hypothetical protein ABRQ23_04945 [Syntrophomonadaceae bacterium]